MVTQHCWRVGGGGGGGGEGVQCFFVCFVFEFLKKKILKKCVNELGLNPSLAKKEKTR